MSAPRHSLLASLQLATARAVKERGVAPDTSDLTLSQIERLLQEHKIPLQLALAEAAALANRSNPSAKQRQQRNALEFAVRTRPPRELSYTEKSSIPQSISSDATVKSVASTNLALELLHEISELYNVDIFRILGLRNLSSFVGEVFKKEFHLHHPGRFFPNPNQDGYPDLCALTKEGDSFLREHTIDSRINTDKALWTSFPYGGVEIKATCGNTPAARIMRKPDIGEMRCPTLRTAEWKAHHQLTQILLGIFWDFVDGLPTVLAAFYRNDLDVTVGAGNRDWGAVIQPSEQGGRTTSVSIMKRGQSRGEGVRKMGAGWIVLPRDPMFLKPICRVFDVDPPVQAARSLI